MGRRLSTFTATKYIQRFTPQQKTLMEKFSSVSYLPSHSHVYLEWLTQFAKSLEWDRWLLLFLAGVIIGLTAALLKQCIQLFNKLRWDTAKDFASEEDIVMTWIWNSGIAVSYILISSFIVVFIHPPAVGSGVPEVISYLNGVTVHGVFSLKCFVIKFVSLVFAVSSGLPAATQGPIIALGAIVGAGIGQFHSKALGCHPKVFTRFRNAEDRRVFTTAGVAAGVAAGFNAPIGGLLFAMEDLSSFWSKSLSWQTFFCSGIAALVANIINTSFNAFQYRGGTFGFFSLSIIDPIQIHVLILCPAIILGIVGGLLGALFTRLNVFLVRTRNKILAKIKNLKVKGIVRMLETVLLVLIMSCTTTLLPLAFDCTVEEEFPNETIALQECGFAQGFNREPYNCNLNISEGYIQYSEVATLMQGTGTTFIEKLTTRNTHHWFSYAQLGAILPIWYFMTIWTCGSAIAGGIFIPNLISGAIYGRMLGMGMVDLWAYFNPEYIYDVPIGTNWNWMDPGIIAVIGSGSLLGGVTRLNLAVTVIVVEMSNDLDLTVPVLISIWLAKIVADLLSKPLFKYQLDGKALPYLDQDPIVVINKSIVNLELYEARDVMHSPVLNIKATENLHTLASILLETSHSGFPVVQYDKETRAEHVVGIITRTELFVLLCSDDVYNVQNIGAIVTAVVEYEQISVDYISDTAAATERVRTYTKSPIYHSIFLNVERYMNRSVTKVDKFYSLNRTYTLFRTLGLRHLLVTDKNNRVVGIITRKDLMQHQIETRISRLFDNSDEESIITESPAITKRVSYNNNNGPSRDSILEEDEEDDGASSIVSAVSDKLPVYSKAILRSKENNNIKTPSPNSRPVSNASTIIKF